MSKYSKFSFNDIDARLTALEGANTPTMPLFATVASEPSNETLNPVVRLRRRVLQGDRVDSVITYGMLDDISYTLAALDRVTQERDDAQSQLVLREAFHERESVRINARIADIEAQLASVEKALGVDQEDSVWWLPGDPSPVQCDSLADAVRATHRLADNDIKRIESEKEDLRAQLAARVDAKPMERLPIDGMHWFENGLRMAKPAVPVYEHPPAAVIEPTTTGATAMDAEIIASIRELENVDGFPILYNATINHIVAVLRPLFDRAEHREPPKAVGACVVWKGGEVARSWMPTEYRAQKQCESLAVQNAILDAGTAHRLVLGEEITP